MPASYHDWETDPRPFKECLGDWMRANGYANHIEAAAALGVEPFTFKGWYHAGRSCPHEVAFRRLMTLLDRLPPNRA